MLELLALLMQQCLFFLGYITGRSEFPPALNRAEEAELIGKLDAGDHNARQELITHNLRLVSHIARKYQIPGYGADDLKSLSFVDAAQDFVFHGQTGRGKTHLAIALGIKAAEASYPVLFDSATGWIHRLAQAHAKGGLERELRRLNRYRLLIIDEVGYLPLDAAAAALFFQLVASRYETGSIIVTSNLPFSRWGETLGDDVVAAATIDRLVHHAHVIGLDGDSYRTRAHRDTINQQTK